MMLSIMVEYKVYISIYVTLISYVNIIICESVGLLFSMAD